MKESRYSAIIMLFDKPVSVVIAAKDENDAKQRIRKQFGVDEGDSYANVLAVWRHDPKDDPKG